ncbi:MAG: hypothetical protein KDA99_09875, partial [Planctomycetales bacterium]|nr:hypothetical protein [Planctomycetales bacterium]
MDSDRSGNAEIDRLCDEFEQALRANQETRLEKYLALAPAALQNQAFHELLKVELEIRSEQRTAPTRAEYLARFAERSQAVE